MSAFYGMYPGEWQEPNPEYPAPKDVMDEIPTMASEQPSEVQPETMGHMQHPLTIRAIAQCGANMGYIVPDLYWGITCPVCKALIEAAVSGPVLERSSHE